MVDTLTITVRKTTAWLDEIAEGFGLYVHVPFCTQRCDYCAFATWTDRGALIDDYVDALCTELARAKDSPGWRSPATVFFGGGTPSLLSASQLARVIAVIAPRLDAEITVECNPESTSRDLLAGFHDAGVNRISLGVQSLKAHVLDGLGRHMVEGALARALRGIGEVGFTNYNVDLVYGGAGESTRDWQETLSEVLAFDPQPTHISAYALTIEAGTPLARAPERHPDEDLQAERYDLADSILQEHGYGWYEISNWAKPGSVCRHNLSCWLGGEYLGIGCAAHSHVKNRRFRNIWSIDRYLAAIADGRPVALQGEQLDPKERLLERLELLLRTSIGVPCRFLDQSALDAGLVSEIDGRYVLTLRGRMLANEVALRLTPLGEDQLLLPIPNSKFRVEN